MEVAVTGYLCWCSAEGQGFVSCQLLLCYNLHMDVQVSMQRLHQSHMPLDRWWLEAEFLSWQPVKLLKTTHLKINSRHPHENMGNSSNSGWNKHRQWQQHHQAVKKMGLFNMSCVGPTLNLAVKKSFKINQALARICKFVGYFHRSSKAASKLREKQQLLGIKDHSLINDCVTRWGST